MRVWVELSGENPALAHAELRGAAEAEGLVRTFRQETSMAPGDLEEYDSPTLAAAVRLAGRLALARRVLAPWPERGAEGIAARLTREGQDGRSARIRRLHSPHGPGGPMVAALGRAYVRGGGRIRLDSAERSFWVSGDRDRDVELAETLAEVDRAGYEARRMPALPFRRPVSLPPRRARAAANLATIRFGDRVVDPFLGTGSLLIEAALLGARVHGVDRDPAMVRGALRNFAHFGLHPDRLEVDDALDAAHRWAGPPIDAVLTDPPYGRASATGGEAPAALIRRTLPAWAGRVRPGGRIVVVGPGGSDPLGPPWRLETLVVDRVHRSLTREFRVYRGSRNRTRSTQ